VRAPLTHRYEFSTQKPVPGSQALDIPHTEAASPSPTETVTIDIAGRGWNFKAGTEYYMTISSYVDLAGVSACVFAFALESFIGLTQP
jgi:hypothetical protein